MSRPQKLLRTLLPLMMLGIFLISLSACGRDNSERGAGAPTNRSDPGIVDPVDDGGAGAINTEGIDPEEGTITNSDGSVLVIIPPLVSGISASNISQNTAKFQGLINPQGFERVVYFEWGLDTGYGNKTLMQVTGQSSIVESVSQEVNGLASNTTYHYRLVSAYSGNLVFSANQQFTTDPNSAILSWDANVEPDLAGYNIYYWIDPNQKQAIWLSGDQLTHTFTNLPPGDYFFSATAFDVSGNESPFSNIVFKTLG